MSSAFKGCEAAILYTSGFASNAGSLLAMLDDKDCAILDLYVHASIIDGCRQTNVQHFRHNDIRALERVLAHTDGKYRTRLVIVDGVYSMDGDIALLDQIVERAHAHGARMMPWCCVEAALARLRAWVSANGLTLHPDKTHVGDCRVAGQGFEFLGYRFEAGKRWVRKKSLMSLRDRIRAKTKRNG